jgi:hypothetical protein
MKNGRSDQHLDFASIQKASLPVSPTSGANETILQRKQGRMGVRI